MSVSELQAQVVRYDVRKTAVVRNAVPILVLVTTLSRYAGTYAMVAALVLQAMVLALFVRARTNLKHQTLRGQHDALIIVHANQTVRRRATTGWTLSKNTARVYGKQYSYRLKAAPDQSDALAGLLAQALGARTETKPRGSARARSVALAISIGGVLALGVGFVMEILPLGLFGIAGAIIGSATFGALSQQVAADPELRAAPPELRASS
jgi:hypothetical protein